jgi:hypothetical protein
MIAPLIDHEMPLVASWASLFMLLFGAVGTAIGLRVLWIARGWTTPAQDAKLRALRRDVDLAYAKSDGVEREQLQYRREQNEMVEAIRAEIRAVGLQVTLLKEVRDTLRLEVDRVDQLERDLTSLACFERDKRTAAQLPSFCPLRQVTCPLEKPGEVAPPAVEAKE